MADKDKTHVDASELGKKARRIKYEGSTYRIGSPSNATQKGKKYQVQVEKLSNGKVVQKKTVSWGAKGYQDYKTHNDPERRKRFQARHQGIKKKDGTPAHKDPMSPAYYATKYNWSRNFDDITNFSYMTDLEIGTIFSNVSIHTIKFMN